MNRISLVLAAGVFTVAAPASAQVATPSDPVVAPSAVAATPAVMAPVLVGPAYGPVTALTVTSAGEPMEVGLAPPGLRLRRDTPMRYDCRTPCTLRPPQGQYLLVLHSEAGQISSNVALWADAESFAVTPPRSRAGGVALMAGGGVVLAAGFLLLLGTLVVDALTSITSSFNGTPYYITGAALALGGTALLVPGVLVLRAAAGHVDQTSGPRYIAGRSRGPRVLTFGAVPIVGGAMTGLTVAF